MRQNSSFADTLEGYAASGKSCLQTTVYAIKKTAAYAKVNCCFLSDKELIKQLVCLGSHDKVILM